jgi:hypothetical protein
MLADLDRATSRTDAYHQAKDLPDQELKKRLDEGVMDLLGAIRTAELRPVYATTLLEEFRREFDNRSRAAAARNLASAGAGAKRARDVRIVDRDASRRTRQLKGRANTRVPGPRAMPDRELEANFRPLYNGQNFDGWEAFLWRQAQGGSRLISCRPIQVVFREPDRFITRAVDGGLRSEKLFAISSFKLDYMIVPGTYRAQTKARNPSTPAPHFTAEFHLDKAARLGQAALCTSVTMELGPANSGDVITRAAGGANPTRRHDASASAAHSPGEWNEVEVRAGERSVQFFMNGVEVNRLESSARLVARVGFLFRVVEVNFGNLRIAESSAHAVANAASQGESPVRSLGGKRYQVLKEAAFWRHAKAKCLQLRGHLAVVHSEAEHKFLTGLVKEAGLKGCWLGATDELREGHWTWVDGTSVDFERWDKSNNQPDDNHDEDYLLLRIAPDGSGRWTDEVEELHEEATGFICQWDN